MQEIEKHKKMSIVGANYLMNGKTPEVSPTISTNVNTVKKANQIWEPHFENCCINIYPKKIQSYHIYIYNQLQNYKNVVQFKIKNKKE